MGFDPRQRRMDVADERLPLPPFDCDTYLLGCPPMLRGKCTAAQRCTGEDETMG
jgi:hypothetical protein